MSLNGPLSWTDITAYLPFLRTSIRILPRPYLIAFEIKDSFFESLEKINLHADDGTDLILSQLHFDHIGGIGERVDGETGAVFKNATCHIHKTHYDYSLSPTLRDSGSFHQKNFLPIIDWYKNNQQLKFHTGEEGEIISLESDSIKFKCSHGHTPFLMHPFDSKFIYLADLIPTSNHVHIPWVMGYDISPGVTTEDKVKFLDFIKDEDLTVIYEHDPIYWGSKIAQGKRSLEAQQLIKAPESEAYRLEL